MGASTSTCRSLLDWNLRSRSQKFLRHHLLRLCEFRTLAHISLALHPYTALTRIMFKRVEKRIRKKEKEEELGLDGDMKEMLGMNDTDSDESESESSGSEDESGDEVMEVRAEGSDVEGDEEAEEDAEDQEMEDGDEEAQSEPGSEDEDEDEDDEPSMTVTEALQNPIYLVSLEPEVKACIVCPGKLLKNSVMTDVHLSSNVSTHL